MNTIPYAISETSYVELPVLRGRILDSDKTLQLIGFRRISAREVLEQRILSLKSSSVRVKQFWENTPIIVLESLIQDFDSSLFLLNTDQGIPYSGITFEGKKKIDTFNNLSVRKMLDFNQIKHLVNRPLDINEVIFNPLWRYLVQDRELLYHYYLVNKSKGNEKGMEISIPTQDRTSLLLSPMCITGFNTGSNLDLMLYSQYDLLNSCTVGIPIDVNLFQEVDTYSIN